MALSRLLFLATLAVSVVSTPSGLGPRTVHGASDTIPRGWSAHRRADPDAVVPLKLALVQSNLDKLDEYLLDIADPFSPNYGKHWTPSQVADTFRPSDESVESVRSWLLDDLGLDAEKVRLNGNRDTIMLDVTVSEAEDILGAEYFVYRYGQGEDERLGCHGGYSLPEHISKHVDLVSPTVHFRPPLNRRGASTSSGTPGTVQGPVIKKTVSDVSGPNLHGSSEQILTSS